MRILLTSDLYLPVINGVAVFTDNLARGLVGQGHEVAIIAPSQTGKPTIEDDNGITIYRVRSVIFPFYQNIRICLTPQLEIRSIIKEFKPDIIHSQMPLGIGQSATMIGRRFDIPLVSTSHSMPENLMENLKKLSAFSRPINYILADMGRRFHDKSDAVTSPTQSGIDGFGKFAAKIHAPIRVISNGINLEKFTPGKPNQSIYNKYNLPTDKQIITYLGRLDAEKRVWVLLKALRELIQNGLDVHMLIVGSGVDLDNEKRIAHELGIADHVTFTGRVPEEDKADLHRVGTIFAVASPAELQCIAALEALASGQPIVAVNAGALGELCHDGENGFLFELDDYRAAAEAINKILTNSKLRESMSKESLALARTHDITHTLQEFTELYTSVIEQKKAELASRPTGWRDKIKESSFAEFMNFGLIDQDDEDNFFDKNGRS